VSTNAAPIGAIMLDTGPLSLLTERPGRPLREAAQKWLDTLTDAGIPVYVPEVADYELRRELVRASHAASIGRLDTFIAGWPPRYVTVTTTAWRLAADLWAQARNAGQQTAPPEALDGDVILAAQAITLAVPGLVVATTNPAHLSRFIAAALWQDIAP
jgi:predicted nucleic acid-binding protein